MKKVFKWGLAAVVVLIAISVVAGAFSSSDKSPSKKAAVAKVAHNKKAPKPETGKAQVKAPVKEKTPSETSGQENARHSAEDYIAMQGFSRTGLIQQLSSDAGDGYSVADATYAVDHIDVNWNEQAVRSAKSYLEMQSFSRKGLIEQLESSAGDGFTHAQAVYGANHAY